MYGTVAHLRLKPATEKKLREHLASYEHLRLPGHVSTVLYRCDADPLDLRMAVVFESRETYLAIAGSPAQDARYREMLDLLEGPPEWHDGGVIYRMG
jgi:hypothetical protein